MRAFIYLTLILLVYPELLAQIPNGGFEEWEQFETYERPRHWETNQDTDIYRLEKDTLSVEGRYSMKISSGATSAWTGCWSKAWAGVNLATPVGENKSLTFFLKSIPDSSNQTQLVYFRISGSFFIDGNFDSYYSWEIFERLDEFTKIQIPITNANTDSLTIDIFGGATGTAVDDCAGYSFSWVDGLTISETEATNINSDLGNLGNKMSIYPNPSNGVLKIGPAPAKIIKYDLYSIGGKLIESGYLREETLRLENKTKGVFLIKLADDSRSFEVARKIIIE